MLFFRRWECAAKITGRITFRSTSRYSIAKYLSAVLHRPMGSLQRTSAFDSTQHCEQFRRFDFPDGSFAEPRKDIIFESPQDAVAMIRHPSR